jgi:Ca2+-binding RTX toxin-like protein
MATTFQVLYLGRLASIDVIEDDGVNERAGVIVGSYGSASQPLRDQVQIFSRVESATGGSRDAYDYENANDRFSINGGKSQTYDGAALYDAVLTYSDGTTAKIRVPVFQDDIGNTYVAPPLASDPATLAALEAQPIQSIKLTQVVNSVGVMSADRATPDYISPVDGTSGDDFMSDGYTDAEGDQVGSGDDYIFGGNGNDTVLGGSGRDTIYGGAGDDYIDGGAGNDTIFGGDGNDTLSGGHGDDSLIGGAGADTLEGGAGDDTLDGGAGTDKAVFVGPVTEYSFDHDPSGALIVTDSVPDRDGADTISGFEYVEFNGVTYHLVTGDDGSNTTLQGPGDGTPSIIIAHDGNDWGGGHATSDVIFGGAGDDTLDGGDGNDTLLGEDGNDLLRGDGGDDSLIGGAGADTLEGGAGNDVFTYAVGDGADTITDFNSGNTGALGDSDSTNNDFINLSGYYDSLSELRADFADDGILNQSNTTNLSGNAVDYSNNDQFESGDSLTFQGANQNSFTADNTGVVCFTSGTLILTPSGEVPIDFLRPGDLVVTKDNGPRPLLWSSMRRLGPVELGRMPHLKPIEIKPGAFGNHSALVVSPQHGVLVNYDNNETLVRAKHLAEMRGGVRIKKGCRAVTYCHLLFEKHEVIFSNGLPSESFFPGPEAIKTLDSGAYNELITLFPLLSRELDKYGVVQTYGQTARGFLQRKELPAEISALR